MKYVVSKTLVNILRVNADTSVFFLKVLEQAYSQEV